MSEARDPFRAMQAAATRRHEHNEHVLKSLAGGGGGPHDPAMETRVARLEQDVRGLGGKLDEIGRLVVRIDAQLPYLATDAKVEKSHGEMMAALAGKPGVAGMWGMGITLFAPVVAAMSAGAVYLPLLTRMLRTNQ